MEPNPATLQDVLADMGLSVQSETLFTLAFTHASYANERGADPGSDNERLEFLGDAVVELAVSEYLYEAFPKRPEGELAKMRAAVVCADSLAGAARTLDLGRRLRLGKGEELTGGRSRVSLLSNTFESVVGALYLDQGWETAKVFVVRALGRDLDRFNESASAIDAKSALQERLQTDSKAAPIYRLVAESGPDHKKAFTSEVVHDGSVLGRGHGHSKKASEQAAACRALRALDET